MKKTTIFCFLALASFFMYGCGNSSNSENEANQEVKVDTVWNEKIQDEFFGVKFGASKQQVISALSKKGLTFNKQSSTNDFLHFLPSSGKYFSYGNLDWEHVDVNIQNDKFYRINFYTAHKDKQTAQNSYENLKSIVTQKYSFMDFQPADTTMYNASIALGKNKVSMGISCRRYESVGNEIFIANSLEYWDESNQDENKVSSDL